LELLSRFRESTPQLEITTWAGDRCAPCEALVPVTLYGTHTPLDRARLTTYWTPPNIMQVHREYSPGSP
jgi:hypothetical protein